MWVGTLELDLLLGESGSLKAKRSVVRPVLAEVARRYAVSAAEVGHVELHRRALIGVGLVSGDHSHVVDVLDAVERFVAARPETELLSARRTVRSTDDD